MTSFNKVILLGNLTRDPEVRYTPNGSAVASFAIAVNRKYKQGEETKEEVSYIDIVVFGKQAENCANISTRRRCTDRRPPAAAPGGKIRIPARSGAKWWRRSRDLHAQAFRFRGRQQAARPSEPRRKRRWMKEISVLARTSRRRSNVLQKIL
jgi:hypothetical protein